MNFYDIILAKKLSGGGGGITPTGTINIVNNGSYDVTNYAGASVAVPQPSGSISITENGTVDVTQYASAIVAVSGGGGGSSNIVTGTFTVGNTGGVVETVNIPYTGDSFPVELIFAPTANFWGTVKRYSIGHVWIRKKNDDPPSYDGGSTSPENRAELVRVYKTSASSSSEIGAARSDPYSQMYDTGDPTGAASAFIRIYDKKTMKYFVANGTSSSYGFMPGATYKYYAIYKE